MTDRIIGSDDLGQTLLDKAKTETRSQTGTARTYYRQPNGMFAVKPTEDSRSAVPDTSVESGHASQKRSTSVTFRTTGPGITRVGPPANRSIPVLRR